MTPSPLATARSRDSRIPGARGIRALRPAKENVDPWQTPRHVWEEERRPEGGTVPVLTAFLTGAECPFSCVFCDLWTHTLNGPTPPGAIPAQLRGLLGDVAPLPDPVAVKLYNASNFFEARAVPPADLPAVADLLRPFARVTVECHPRLIGDDCPRFAERLDRRLEVAMGLETIRPDALLRLNKGMTLADFDRAAAFLRNHDVGLRVFVLVAAPYVPAGEAVEWAVRSAAYAFERGAGRVSLIPVRDGNGALEALAQEGQFVRPELAQLEEAQERCIGLGAGIVTADLWDADRLATCAACAGERLARLGRMNLTGELEPRISCEVCGA